MSRPLNHFRSRGPRRGRREAYVPPAEDFAAPYSSWGYGIPDVTALHFAPSIRARMTAGQGTPTGDGGNISWGWAGTGVNDASAGDTAWTNPGNALVSDNTYATCALSGNESQYLKLTNFTLQRAVPATAQIVGITFWVEGQGTANYPGLGIVEAKMIVGGSIVGNDLAADQDIGGLKATTPEKSDTRLGDRDQVWGLTPTPAQINASDFGVAIRVQEDGTGAGTVQIDSVRVMVYWQDTVDCVVTALGPTSGKMAPYVFFAEAAYNSVWGDCHAEEVSWRWTVSGPVGWSMTTTDPRAGTGVNGQTRDCASDAVGPVMGWLFDVDGTYTVSATMYYNDVETGAILTRVSNEITVTVEANTRTAYHLKPGNGQGLEDGSSEANAWGTIDAAVDWLTANDTADVELIVYDDETESVTTTPSEMVNFTNLYIRRSGGGTAKPTFSCTSAHALPIRNSSDVVIDGIRVEWSGSGNKPYFFGVNNYDITRWCVTNCEGQNLSSFNEIKDAGTNDQILHINNSIDDFERYIIYISARNDTIDSIGRNVVVVGNVSTTTIAFTGEGHYRFNDSYRAVDRGYGCNLMWTSCSAPSGNPHSVFRHGFTWWHAFQCKFSDGPLSMAHGGYSDRHSLEFVGRMDGLDVPVIKEGVALTGLSPPALAKHILVCNSRIVTGECVIGGAGNVYVGKLFCNTIILASGAGSSASFFRSQIDTTELTVDQYEWVGNLFLTELAPASWSGRYWRNGTPRRWLTRSECNAYAKAIWMEAGVSYTSFASWNGLEGIANETEVAGISASDCPVADDYYPDTTTYPSVICVPDSVPHGVFWDYRGIDRVKDGGSWTAGCTGDEI